MDLLLRSLLYVPAAEEAVLRKAGTRGADALVIDLEDALHPDAKPAARDRVRRLWPALDGTRFLRVNASGTPWHEDDLAVAAEIRPAAVVVPKCDDPKAVARVVARLHPVPLLLMIETARGVLAAQDLAQIPGVRGLVLGGADLRKSLRCPATPEETEIAAARAALVLAARAAQIDVFDTPWFDYGDPDGLRASARRARVLGFDGKTLIHPVQVPIVHEIFTPSTEEIARARRIVEAIDEAAARGLGVATLDGEMVEALHAEEALRLLARVSR